MKTNTKSRPPIEYQFTALPNLFLDVVMPLSPSSYWNVLCAFARKTLGFGKRRDAVSLSQIQVSTELSRDTVLSAQTFYEKAGILLRVGVGPRKVVIREVVVEFDPEEMTHRLKALVDEIDQSSSSTRASRRNQPLPVEEVDTQKTKQETKEDLSVNYLRKSACEESQECPDGSTKEPLSILEGIRAVVAGQLSERMIQWMITVINERSICRTKSKAYWIECVRNFLPIFGDEIRRFLTKQAEIFVRDGMHDGDVREHLKILAADWDLPVSPDLISNVVDSAENRLRAEESLRSETRVGSQRTGPYGGDDYVV